VTLDNAPVAGAQVAFIGEGEKNAPIVALTDNEGKYKLVGHHGRGIPAGKYKVVLSKPALRDGTVPTGEKLEQARADNLLVNVLPRIYEDRTTTPLQFDVKIGPSVIDLPLQKK